MLEHWPVDLNHDRQALCIALSTLRGFLVAAYYGPDGVRSCQLSGLLNIIVTGFCLLDVPELSFNQLEHRVDAFDSRFSVEQIVSHSQQNFERQTTIREGQFEARHATAENGETG